MSLSSGLTLADLSDYLAPSAICIKPVTLVEDTSQDTTGLPAINGGHLREDGLTAATEIVIDQDTLIHYEKGADGLRGKKLKKAEITLNDCLACSGCITSAESVLVSMQSHEEVYRVLAELPDIIPILSVSPQSVASLAALHDLSLLETMRGLRRFFKQELGFHLVFDVTFARAVSLEENRREYIERRAHAADSNQTLTTASAPNTPSASPTGPLPILSSSCPGWICYAEKTHGELLPFVSNVKSPQAIMGAFVKHGDIAVALGLRPEQIYHVTVMPCYDKKLEASRPDFAELSASSSSSVPVRDVDCVLTTGEVQRMLEGKGMSLRKLAIATSAESNGQGLAVANGFKVKDDFEGLSESRFVPSLLLAPAFGTSSGGYVHAALCTILSSLSPSQLAEARIESRKIRNEDYIEYELLVGNQVESRMAKCYGFRNLQNVVRKLGRQKGVSVIRGAAAGKMMPGSRRNNPAGKMSGGGTGEKGKEVEFIEVMACPSGCVNGGGQIAPPRESRGERRRKLGYFNEGPVDEEGMPDMGDRMSEDVHEEEEEDERVLGPKEWVALVEKTYWSVVMNSSSSDHDDDNKAVTHHLGIDPTRLHPSLQPYLSALHLASSHRRLIDTLINRLIDESSSHSNPFLSDSSSPKLYLPSNPDSNESISIVARDVDMNMDSREERRRNLLRTSYRAVESEDINALEVKW